MMWWKILGVVLIVYAITFGLLVPLKPGIVSCTPTSVESGDQVDFLIEGYNSNYGSVNDLKAWIRLENGNYLHASQVIVSNDNEAKLRFEFPSDLPLDGKVVEGTLLVHSDKDGTTLLPNAVFIKQGRDSKRVQTHGLQRSF